MTVDALVDCEDGSPPLYLGECRAAVEERVVGE